MSQLACFVYVNDQAGNTHAFGPGDFVPDWAREKITNPNVWDTVDADVELILMGTGIDRDDSPNTANPTADGPPPQGGPGASRQKWADYAASQGVAVEESWKREDIIAACEKAGKPV